MSPPFLITPCTPSDAPELARAQHTIFQSPIYRTIYATVSPAAQLAKFEQTIAAGLAEQQQQQQQTAAGEVVAAAAATTTTTTPGTGREVTWLKCTSPSTPSSSPSTTTTTTTTTSTDDEIIAYINWIYLPHGYHPEADHEAHVTDMPAGTNLPLIEEFYGAARIMRAQHPGRRAGPHYLLSILGTLPRFERRGAATRLIGWGLERADERCVPCYVDSSVTGRKLYERMGFRECGGMEVDLGAFGGGEGEGGGERGGEGVQRWVAMRREPVGRAVSGG